MISYLVMGKFGGERRNDNSNMTKKKAKRKKAKQQKREPKK